MVKSQVHPLISVTSLNCAETEQKQVLAGSAVVRWWVVC